MLLLMLILNCPLALCLTDTSRKIILRRTRLTNFMDTRRTHRASVTFCVFYTVVFLPTFVDDGSTTVRTFRCDVQVTSFSAQQI